MGTTRVFESAAHVPLVISKVIGITIQIIPIFADGTNRCKTGEQYD